ncbi:PREDICTED: lymphocyte function-associated antigen 3 [Gekko japonicus]|uniref:Lymphocyte function-associated antigen 3 n=1 Tax=Gekko japonicus TaxID=146911 RepID=A0ABM1JVI5_GEKJA|nr:PREDICTED: lymphocyte function-associated antigen 3 [Gekko japonicus]
MRKDGGGLAAAAALCTLSVCLGCLQKPPLERFGVVGGAVTLEPELNARTNLSDISWKRGKDSVAEWDAAHWFASGLKGRAELDSATGRLTLIKLQQNDSGEYTADILVGGKIQCTLFSLQVLEPPEPPLLNCTAVGDRIQVRCEPDDQYVAANISQTYKWKYQKSNKEIPGNSSEIWLEKDADFSENITCVIHVLDANTSSSIRLRDCTPTGAVSQRRGRAPLFTAFAIVLTAWMVFFLWKIGCFNLKRKGKFNLKRKRKSQECKDGTDATEVTPEVECLREECPENLGEDSSKGPADPGT